MTAPLCSAVITAHNASRQIGACLRSLAAQEDVPGGALEIVLVDDRSSDGTADAAAREGGGALRVMRIDSCAPGRLTARQRALDLGIRAARGEWIFLLDADSAAPPRWIAGGLDALAASRADALAGPVEFRGPPGFWAAMQSIDSRYYFAWSGALNALGLDAAAQFGNFAFRRADYEALGGFESIGFALTEDLAFARALKAAGRRIAFASRAAPPVRVCACPSFGALVARAQRVSAGPLSPLSLSLGLWMIGLAGLGAAAGLAGGPWLAAFAARYAVGAALAARGVWARGGRSRATGALVYEPLAIAVALCVAARLARSRTIEWGGARYER